MRPTPTASRAPTSNPAAAAPATNSTRDEERADWPCTTVVIVVVDPDGAVIVEVTVEIGRAEKLTTVSVVVVDRSMVVDPTEVTVAVTV